MGFDTKSSGSAPSTTHRDSHGLNLQACLRFVARLVNLRCQRRTPLFEKVVTTEMPPPSTTSAGLNASRTLTPLVDAKIDGATELLQPPSDAADKVKEDEGYMRPFSQPVDSNAKRSSASYSYHSIDSQGVRRSVVICLPPDLAHAARMAQRRRQKA